MIIAAVAEANDCVLVTDNEKDFVGLKTVNPSAGRELRLGGGRRRPLGVEDASSPTGFLDCQPQRPARARAGGVNWLAEG